MAVGGCRAVSAPVVVTANEPNAADAQLKTYPNPTTDQLVVRYYPRHTPAAVVVKVYSPLGVLVRQQSLQLQPGNHWQAVLSMPPPPPGRYLIWVGADKEIFIRAVVKQ